VVLCAMPDWSSIPDAYYQAAKITRLALVVFRYIHCEDNRVLR